MKRRAGRPKGGLFSAVDEVRLHDIGRKEVMLHKLRLNCDNRAVKKDLKNVHDMHMTMCRMFDKGVLWRRTGHTLIVRDTTVRELPVGYVKSISIEREEWSDEADFTLTAYPAKIIRPDKTKKNGLRVPADPLPWLTRKATLSGFEIITVQASSPRVVRGHKKGQSLIFHAIDFDGRLRILERKVFMTAVTAGIGPAKGYGFGLMLPGGCGA